MSDGHGESEQPEERGHSPESGWLSRLDRFHKILVTSTAIVLAAGGLGTATYLARNSWEQAFGLAGNGTATRTPGPVGPTFSSSPTRPPTLAASSPPSSPAPTTGTPGPAVNSTFIEGASDTPFAGKCVDVRGPSAAQDTPVQIWDCKQVDEMRWQLNSSGAIQGFGGNCLTVVGDNAGATPVLMEQCNDTPDQHWQMQPDGHISYTGGRCLDIQGPSINDGTALQIWQCKNVPEELWQLTPRP